MVGVKSKPIWSVPQMMLPDESVSSAWEQDWTVVRASPPPVIRSPPATVEVAAPVRSRAKAWIPLLKVEDAVEEEVITPMLEMEKML